MDRHKRIKKTTSHYLIKFGILSILLAAFIGFGVLTERDIESVQYEKSLYGSNETLYKIYHDDDDDDCKPRGKLDPCKYIQENEECQPDGKLDYLYLYYCSPLANKPWATYIILIMWIIGLFYVLGKTADYFFCPSLEELSSLLKMSPEVAGLTLLALGNGAPDVSSVIAGVVGSNSFSIAIGELFGAGLFVTSIVVAMIVLVSGKVKLSAYDFLRDNLSYIISVIAVFFITWSCRVGLVESIILLLFYIFYVVVALMVHYCKCSCFKKRSEYENINALESTPLLEGMEYSEEEEFKYFTLRNWYEWFTSKHWVKRIFIIISTIIYFPVYISIPGSEVWNRYQVVLVPVTSIPVIFLAFDLFGKTVNGFPLVVIVMLCMIVFSVIIFFTTEWDKPPVYKYVFLPLCFGLSVAWIYITANELVSVLKTFGILFNISHGIMGSTVLAWGNSIGDMVSNIAITRKGIPTMAMSASYGGPIFNLLVGLGLAMLIKNIKTYPNPFPVIPDQHFFATSGFLFFCLYATLFMVLLRKFKVYRSYGIFLLILYVSFTIIIILIEAKVIWKTIPDSICA